ncbi:MAG TPA: hypothetical protein VMT03_02080 [Polyangia bacterium]|nr:hypothetical protein [Polyangia bacterium]
MNYFSLYRSFLVVLAVEVPNAVLGAWVRLQSYATSDGVESSTLEGAREWDERRWMICCQVSSADVEAVVAHKLARWEGADLLLEGFDSKGLAALEKKRGQGPHGRKGGAGKHRPKAGTPKGNSTPTEANPEGNPMGSVDRNPYLGKGGEGIRSEGKGGKEIPALPPRTRTHRLNRNRRQTATHGDGHRWGWAETEPPSLPSQEKSRIRGSWCSTPSASDSAPIRSGNRTLSRP